MAMKFFLLRFIIPIYFIVALFLFFIAISHLTFSGIDVKNNPSDTRLGLFGVRLFCAISWPLMLISKPGRKFMFASIRDLF